VLAARGTCQLQGREEPLTDAGSRQQARRQARRVYVIASLLALGLTVVCVLLPV
jgi:hypothetical protein